MDSPFTDVPDDEDWYCPQCKTDVLEVIKAGEKLRLSNKKAKMVSKKQETNRDWGKGMVCAWCTKVCTLVPSDHFGPIRMEVPCSINPDSYREEICWMNECCQTLVQCCCGIKYHFCDISVKMYVWFGVMTDTR
ncbi:hypothetical protein EMCRGX_G034101 [Ephydatia muelleri]